MSRTRTQPRPWWALLVAMVAVAAVVRLLASIDGSPGEDAGHAMVQVAPGGEVVLASVPVEQRVLYEAAAADEEAFGHVTCYCGCETFLGHRHLLDCFVRPDGGWEQHAMGCAVCLAQAEDVVDMRRQDLPLVDITDRIDQRYGGLTAPSA